MPNIDPLTIGCRYCHAPIGEHCINRRNNGAPLNNFDAHLTRIKDAEQADQEIPF